MKYFKKLVATVTAIALALSMGAVAAFGAGEGKIAINDAVADQTYKAYQVLELESYNADSEAYSYKAAADWADFINDADIDGVYVNVDDQGYVTWIEGANVADFAKLAKAYADQNTISATATKKADSTTVEFTGLDLGYYLVDTTLGTICSLDTTNPEVVIEEKNEAPTVTKEVKEDSTGVYGAANDADFNQAVNFKATITVQAGAENYILHDTMSAGLTWNGAVAVMVNDVAVDAANYDLVANPGDGCTFDVAFKDSYVASLAAGTQIVVSYSATLNQDAVVGLPGNSNEAVLEYGDDADSTTTPKAETITYTWDMDVLKYGNGNESNVLTGAEFILLNADKTQAAKVENGKLAGWVAVADATKLTTNTDGKIEINGLDADTYYLRETAAPAGYNKLAADIQVVVNAAEKNEADVLEYTTVIAKVNNQSGTELPSTGGMGTTILYAVGAALVLGAGIALVVKRRMASSK